METYCPGVGTGGYTSCRYGDRAVINLARWETAVPDYEGDVATYRQYVVNHEVGHALGNGHQQCPGPGQPAPVMQQQTLGLQGCAKNAWPHP
jgi:predicted Zn-dependent protease